MLEEVNFEWISFKKIKGRRSATYKGAACIVQHRYCWVDGTWLQLFIFEGYSEVLAINSKWYRPFVHIEEYAEHTLSFKDSSVAGTLGVWVMPQLAHPEESPSKFVVAKCCSLVTFLWLTDSNFQFVLRPCVGHNLPVVDSFREADISEEGAEEVVLFLQENPTIVLTNVYDRLWKCVLQVDFPDEARDQNTHDLPLQSKLLHSLLKFLLSEVSTLDKTD